MSHTAIKSEEAKKEYFDSPAVLEKKVQELADMILESNNFTVFTGAGISTASGIPDYRSGANTVLKTGAGCWEKAANIQKAKREGKLLNAPAKPAEFNIKISQAMPSKTHMAMVEMMERGILKHVISQNIDGLHRKSGIPGNKISELHGNTNLEICKKCGKDYMRDFRTRTSQKNFDHATGRNCDNTYCNGGLHDSIINFGEHLNEKILETGEEKGQISDVMLAMGSSLSVTPACDIPKDMA
jgi:NAD-dependent SIR2 family protein deacetylase